MDRRILVLSLATFAMATETYVYAGHLSALAADLGVTIPAAGQLSAAFAITYALSAPVTAGYGAALDRRTVLVAGLVAVGLLNIAAALATGFTALLAIRILCGIAAGVVGPAAAAAAAALAPPERRGRALATVLAGTTLAFVLGIPLGSVVGDLFGWRATFHLAGILALLAALATRLLLPAVPGGERAGLGTLLVAREPAVSLPLALTLVSFAATFAVTAYIGPVTTRISGLEGAGVGAIQAMIGIGSIVGVALGGRAADRPDAGGLLPASFLASAAALATLSALMLASGPHPILAVALGLAIGLSAAALFSRAPVIQARLVAAAPQARSVALALNGSMIFAGQGLGAALGGLVISGAGLPWVGIAGAAVALLGYALSAARRRAPAAADA